MVQVSHLSSLFIISKEPSKALTRQLNVFVFIAACIRELSLDVFPLNMMSYESQVASFKSFIVLTLMRNIVSLELLWDDLCLKGLIWRIFQGLSSTPSHHTFSTPSLSFFFWLVTSHFCNLHMQMLCSHSPVAGLISDPWSGRWLICCWFQLQQIVPPIIFAQAAA